MVISYLYLVGASVLTIGMGIGAVMAGEAIPEHIHDAMDLFSFGVGLLLTAGAAIVAVVGLGSVPWAATAVWASRAAMRGEHRGVVALAVCFGLGAVIKLAIVAWFVHEGWALPVPVLVGAGIDAAVLALLQPWVRATSVSRRRHDRRTSGSERTR